ncbi:TetR/AcrR family transcriptional regulator [Paenibacillus oleatilyticus]|uniref:TetR/AcrR family transcriptional regulator n=1 Tax=Paenibacillus oleatilyticus TaxID=2594886 RepID=UPI001C1FBA85|nr:TetR/AcrR family transcriptional regulator [Paenibacillus oleatilyticus]MBU7317478.1 WHG domain-containing protein [Paenibacillus oleatilyticus]
MSPRIGLDLPTILQAAVEIADTRGLEEVTLASLAQKLDVRSPSLYNHVNGLSGLRSKLAVYGLEQLLHVMTQAVVGRSGDDAVRELGKAYVTFARAHPGLYDATLRAPDPQDEEVRRLAGETVDLVIRALQAYELKDDAALHAVRGLRSLLHGFSSLEQRGGFGLPLDLDVSFRLLLDTFLAGLHEMKRWAKAESKPT